MQKTPKRCLVAGVIYLFSFQLFKKMENYPSAGAVTHPADADAGDEGKRGWICILIMPRKLVHISLRRSLDGITCFAAYLAG